MRDKKNVVPGQFLLHSVSLSLSLSLALSQHVLVEKKAYWGTIAQTYLTVSGLVGSRWPIFPVKAKFSGNYQRGINSECLSCLLFGSSLWKTSQYKVFFGKEVFSNNAQAEHLWTFPYYGFCLLKLTRSALSRNKHGYFPSRELGHKAIWFVKRMSEQTYYIYIL